MIIPCPSLTCSAQFGLYPLSGKVPGYLVLRDYSTSTILVPSLAYTLECSKRLPVPAALPQLTCSTFWGRYVGYFGALCSWVYWQAHCFALLLLHRDWDHTVLPLSIVCLHSLYREFGGFLCRVSRRPLRRNKGIMGSSCVGGEIRLSLLAIARRALFFLNYFGLGFCNTQLKHPDKYRQLFMDVFLDAMRLNGSRDWGLQSLKVFYSKSWWQKKVL